MRWVNTLRVMTPWRHDPFPGGAWEETGSIRGLLPEQFARWRSQPRATTENPIIIPTVIRHLIAPHVPQAAAALRIPRRLPGAVKRHMAAGRCDALMSHWSLVTPRPRRKPISPLPLTWLAWSA